MEKAKTAGNRKWWIVQQHDEFSVVHAESMPDLSNEPGTRMKRGHGPYKSEEAAKTAADKMFGRTMKGLFKDGV